MRNRYYTIQSVIVLSTFAAAVYSFLQTSLYTNLNSYLFGLPDYFYIISVPTIIAAILYLFMFRNLRNLYWAYVFSIILYLPGALSFSELGFLTNLGLDIQNSLSLETILAIGITVIAGNLLIYSLNQFRSNSIEMEEKGVSEENVKEIFSNQSKYLLSLIVPSGIIAFFFGTLSLRFRWFISNIFSQIPLQHLIVGVVSTIAVLLIVLLFAYNRLK